jgi:hypothetical protein
LIYRVGRITQPPAEEVWIKFGGDKGGSSFKMNFQIVNTPRPNSVQNTCVVTAFEAPDSKTTCTSPSPGIKKHAEIHLEVV